VNEAGPGGRYDRIVDLYVIQNRGKDLWFTNMARPVRAALAMCTVPKGS